MKKEPYGYVYKITNKVNDKTYIGQRKLSRDSSWRGYLGSGKLIQQAVSKYGSEKFIKTFICYAYDSDELSDVEYELIKNEKMIGKCEYNINSNVPDPISRLNSSPERLKEAERKRAEGHKAYFERADSKPKRVAKENAEKYKGIFDKIGQVIINDYNEINSFREVSKKHNLPINRVRTFLLSQGIELNKQNVKGRKLSEEVKNKIKSTARRRAIENGNLAEFKLVCQFTKCSKEFINNKEQKTCSVECASRLRRKRFEIDEKLFLKAKEMYDNGETLIGIQEKLNINRQELAIKLRENGYITHR